MVHAWDPRNWRLRQDLRIKANRDYTVTVNYIVYSETVSQKGLEERREKKGE